MPGTLVPDIFRNIKLAASESRRAHYGKHVALTSLPVQVEVACGLTSLPQVVFHEHPNDALSRCSVNLIIAGRAAASGERIADKNCV
jgi:hypothetical protein